MSALPPPGDCVSPTRWPTSGECFVQVAVDDDVLRVFFHAGAPYWVRRDNGDGSVGLGVPAEIAVGTHAAAIAAAKAFVEQFRLPAVAS